MTMHAPHGERRRAPGDGRRNGPDRRRQGARLRLELGVKRSFAGNGRRDRPAMGFEHRQRLDQNVERLDRPQFAERDDDRSRRARA